MTFVEYDASDWIWVRQLVGHAPVTMPHDRLRNMCQYFDVGGRTSDAALREKRGYKLAAGGAIVDQRSSAGAYYVDRQADVFDTLCRSAAMRYSTSKFSRIL